MILDRIVAQKRIEVTARKRALTMEKLEEHWQDLKRSKKAGPGRFSGAMRNTGEVVLIAEIKKASPSKGLIRPDFDAAEIARIYTASGAAAISVLTDREFFQGESDYLRLAREVSTLPILRNDFVIDEYQIFEAKRLGADAVLLIMAILCDEKVMRFRDLADQLGMECLVEVHTAAELKRALDLGVSIIGINNRDLTTFKTDLATTFRLREMIPDSDIIVVSESGINTRDDVILLQEHGINAMLVGEALMRETDIAGKISELMGRQSNPKGCHE